MSKIKYSEKFIRLWNIYDSNLCHGKKGSKFTALKAFEKYPEDEQERIIEDTRELMRYFGSQKEPDRTPHLSTWLNQRYFDQDIPSQATTVPVESVSCKICGQPSDIPKISRCVDCYAMENDRWYQRRKEICLKAIPRVSGESVSEYGKRSHKYLLESLKSGKLSMNLSLLSEI